MAKKSKGKKKRGKKQPQAGPTSQQRKKNALICSLAHYLEVDKNQLQVDDSGKVTLIQSSEEAEEKEADCNVIEEEANSKDSKEIDDTQNNPIDSEQPEVDTITVPIHPTTISNLTELNKSTQPSLPPSRSTSRHSSRHPSRSPSRSNKSSTIQTSLDLESTPFSNQSSDESSSSESNSSSGSSTDNEEGYDSEGLPNSPIRDRLLPTRPSQQSKWNGSQTIQTHRIHRTTKQKKRTKHRHHGHHHENHKNHKNHKKRNSNNEKEKKEMAATAPAMLQNIQDQTFLTTTNASSSSSKTTRSTISRLADDVQGLQVQQRLAPSQDHGIYHSNPLTRAKNQLWGRNARSSFFNDYRSLDKNVDPSLLPSSPRKDPFAEFTNETLEELKETIPPPLTTTEYESLLENHLTTLTTEEQNIEDQRQKINIRYSNATNSSITGKDPRLVFLRECREKGIPPIPVMDYHRMSKSKTRFSSENGATNNNRNSSRGNGHRIATANMSSLEFDGYGLGDERASAYAAALSVQMPLELSVKTLSLKNNRLTSNGAVSILTSVLKIGTITELDLSDNSIGVLGSEALAKTLQVRTDGKSNLIHVSLANNRLNDHSLSIILKGVCKSETLQSINMSGNQFGKVSSSLLEQILVTGEPFSSTASNDITPVELASLGSSVSNLRSSTVLTRLSLSWCGLTLRHLGWLCSGISKTQNLLHLDLSRNNFGSTLGNVHEEGYGSIEDLSVSIVQGNSIIDVDLSYNSMNDNDGILLLSILLPESTIERSITSSSSSSSNGGDESKKHFLHRLMLDGNNFGERTARQALRGISGIQAPPSTNELHHPTIYLSIRDCDFNVGHTVLPKQPSSSSTTTTATVDTINEGSSSTANNELIAYPVQNVTLSSFDPQCPHGCYELDNRNCYDRHLLSELAVLGRLNGMHSFNLPKYQDVKPLTKTTATNTNLKNNKKGSKPTTKNKKGKVMNTEWYEDKEWTPNPLTIVSFNFQTGNSDEATDGDETLTRWFDYAVDYNKINMLWKNILKTEVHHTNQKTRARLCRNALEECKQLHARDVVPTDDITFRRLISFLHINLLPHDRLDPMYSNNYVTPTYSIQAQSSSGTSNNTNSTSTTTTTIPSSPGKLTSMLAKDRWLTCKQAQELLSLIGSDGGPENEYARVEFLLHAIPRLVDAYDVVGHEQKKKEDEVVITKDVNQALDTLTMLAGENNNNKNDDHHHHHHHHEHANHPKTRLWQLLSTCLSPHARHSLISNLGFSPITPTGSYVIHLSDKKERQKCVNLIGLATTMNMEWSRRSIHQRNVAMAESLLYLSEESRVLKNETEARASKEKKRIHRQEQLQKQEDELQQQQDKDEKEAKAKEDKNYQHRKISFAKSTSPKAISTTPLPIVNDPLNILNNNSTGNNTGNNTNSTIELNLLDEENEWKWSALVLRHQQYLKYHKEIQISQKNKEEDENVPLPDMQRLDTDALAAWHIAIDTSEHYDTAKPPPPTENIKDDANKNKSNKSNKKKKKKKKEKKKLRRRFSCIRNCTYKTENQNARESVSFSLTEHPLPHTGTMTFDFVGSPSTIVETSRVLPHASHIDLLDCLRNIKKFVFIKRKANIKNNKNNKSSNKNKNNKTADSKKNVKQMKSHLHDPNSRARFDQLIHYLATLDHSISSIQCSQIVRIFTSNSLAGLIESWARGKTRKFSIYFVVGWCCSVISFFSIFSPFCFFLSIFFFFFYLH